MKFLRTVLSILMAVLFVSQTWAGSFTLDWIPNTESDLAGYKVYSGSSAGVYGAPVTIGKVTTYTGTMPDDGVTRFFAITAYDTAGNESKFSNEVSKNFPVVIVTAPLLAPPTNVIFTPGAGVGTFTWTPDPNAVATKLYVHESGTPYSPITPFDGTVTGGTKTLTMKYGTAYDCWMTTLNKDGKEGGGAGVSCSMPAAPVDAPPTAPQGVTIK